MKYNKKNNKRYNHGAGCGDEPWYFGSTQNESGYSGQGGVTRRLNLNRVSSIGTACIIHWILVEKPHNSAGRRGCRCCGEWVIYTSHTIASSDLHWDLGWTSITIWVKKIQQFLHILIKKKQIKGIKDEEGAEDWLGFYKSSCTV